MGVNNGSGIFSGVIQNTLLDGQGSGTPVLSIIKAGTGTQTISGNSNTYSGGTTINNGSLRVSNTSGSATGTGTVTIGGPTATTSGAIPTLSGTGFVGSTVVNGGSVGVYAAGHVAPGFNVSGNFRGIGTLTTGDLTANDGSNFDFDLGTPGTGGSPAGSQADLVNVVGTLTLPSSGSVTLNFGDNADAFGLGSFGLGTYKLFTASSIANFSSTGFSVGTAPALGLTYAFTNTGTEIDVTIGLNNWSPNAVSNDWANSANWAGFVPGSVGTTTNKDTALFATASTFVAPAPDAGRNVQNVAFDTAAAAAYTISGPNALHLTSGGAITVGSAVVNPEAVNAPLQIEGDAATYNFTNDSTTGSAL